MSAPLPKLKVRQTALLEKARAALTKNNDDAAMKYFKQACIYCVCNIALLRNLATAASSIPITDLSLPSCHCRKIMSLDRNDDDKQAIYKLATKSCSCGSGIKSCDSQAHIDALNGMAAICGRRKAFKDAIKYSSLLILVAPYLPIGYLRLAKSLRLQDASEGTDTRKQWAAWVYSQLKATGTDSAKLKQLVNVLRVDIISKSPPEIQEMILKNLSYTDLCRCMRVSKTWNCASRNKSLWRHLEFVKRWPTSRIRPFSKGVLNDIISRRSGNQAQSLIISGLKDFAIDVTKLSSLLKGLPRLQSLSLHEVARSALGELKPTTLSLEDQPSFLLNLFEFLCRDAPTGLKTLHLEYFPHPGSFGTFERNTDGNGNLAASLRELKLNDLRCPGPLLHMMEGMQWPNLEKLYVRESDDTFIDLVDIIPVTPALKELSFEHVSFDLPRFRPPHDYGWKNLERLNLVSALPRGWIVPRTSSALRSLDISNSGMKALLDLVIPYSEYEPRGVLDKLEHLRCTGDGLPMGISGDQRRGILNSIKPSCMNGTLRSVHIDFNPQLYDEILNKQVVHTLSCNEIRTPSIHPGGYPGQIDEFLEWLDGFPNLTNLGVFPTKTDNAWLAVAKVVRKLDEQSLVKTIYTDALYGVYRDEVLKQAAKKGIQIIHASRVPEPKLQPLPSREPEAVLQ